MALMVCVLGIYAICGIYGRGVLAAATETHTFVSRPRSSRLTTRSDPNVFGREI
jgi:hypothetical protein